MSCQIKGIANIPNVDNIKKLLYGDTISKCKCFMRYDKYNIHCDSSIYFFQSSMYQAMNYLFKAVLYRCRRLEMYLQWLGTLG